MQKTRQPCSGLQLSGNAPAWAEMKLKEELVCGSVVSLQCSGSSLHGPLGSLVTELGQNYRLQFRVLVSCTPKQCRPPLKYPFLVVTGVSWGICHTKCCPWKDELVTAPGSLCAQPRPAPVQGSGIQAPELCHLLSARVSLQPGTISGMQHRLNISFAFKGYLLLNF